jgi:hypothetical protein
MLQTGFASFCLTQFICRTCVIAYMYHVINNLLVLYLVHTGRYCKKPQEEHFNFHTVACDSTHGALYDVLFLLSMTCYVCRCKFCFPFSRKEKPLSFETWLVAQCCGMWNRNNFLRLWFRFQLDLRKAMVLVVVHTFSERLER